MIFSFGYRNIYTCVHGRPRKNNHPFGIYENIKLGLINYTLLGLIEHHGVFIDSGHYVSYIRQSNKWYHCDDKHITEIIYSRCRIMLSYVLCYRHIGIRVFGH